MEDFYLDIVTGEGLGARACDLVWRPFTLVGATTRAAYLRRPFAIALVFMSVCHFRSNSLIEFLSVRQFTWYQLQEDGAGQVARRSRGTPRMPIGY